MDKVTPSTQGKEQGRFPAGSQQRGIKPCPTKSLMDNIPSKASSHCYAWGRESSSEDKQGQVSSTALLQLSQVLGGIEE